MFFLLFWSAIGVLTISKCLEEHDRITLAKVIERRVIKVHLFKSHLLFGCVDKMRIALIVILFREEEIYLTSLKCCHFMAEK